MKTGESYKLRYAELHVYTRDGMSVTLQPGTVVTKIRDSIIDRIQERCMFKIDVRDIEVDIEPTFIHRYFDRIY